MVLLRNVLLQAQGSLARLALWLDAGASEPWQRDDRRGLFSCAVGLIVVAAMLLGIEHYSPLFFLQDDNYTQFFPAMLHGCRCVEAGEFPDWNPYQFLGAPLADRGTYALTYPPTYASYALAKCLGDERYTIEIFCIGHLLGGYLAMWWCGARVGLHPWLRVALGVSLALSGYALIAGRSWYYMTPLYLWGPLAAGCYAWLSSTKYQRLATLLLGVSLGALFHAGNAQMWFYVMLGVFGATLLDYARECSADRGSVKLTICRIVALTLGVAIAAPLLLTQLEGTSGINRQGGLGTGIYEALNSILWPMPLQFSSHVDGREPTEAGVYFGSMYFFGGVFAWLAVASLVEVVVRRSQCKLLHSAVWWGLVVFLLLALGPATPLWGLHQVLPILSKFSYPIKFLPFVAFFTLLWGAMVLQSIAGASRWWNLIAIVFSLASIGLTLHDASFPKPSFCTFSGNNYPALAPDIAAMFPPPSLLRVKPEMPARYPAEDYSTSLGHNFASYYQIASVDGYDPLVSTWPASQRIATNLRNDRMLREYGVAAVLIYHWGTLDELLHREQTPQPTSSSMLRVIEVKDPRGLIWTAELDSKAFACRQKLSSFEATCAPASRASQGTLNFLYLKRSVVRCNGVRVSCKEDPLGRIQFDMPAGTTEVRLTYEPRWGSGLMLGGVLFVASLGLLTWLPRVSEVVVTARGQLLHRCKRFHDYWGVNILARNNSAYARWALVLGVGGLYRQVLTLLIPIIALDRVMAMGDMVMLRMGQFGYRLSEWAMLENVACAAAFAAVIKIAMLRRTGEWKSTSERIFFQYSYAIMLALAAASIGMLLLLKLGHGGVDLRWPALLGGLRKSIPLPVALALLIVALGAMWLALAPRSKRRGKHPSPVIDWLARQRRFVVGMATAAALLTALHLMPAMLTPARIFWVLMIGYLLLPTVARRLIWMWRWRPEPRS